jgi:hypothetical protein
MFRVRNSEYSSETYRTDCVCPLIYRITGVLVSVCFHQIQAALLTQTRVYDALISG